MLIISSLGLFDTVFDVDHYKERADEAQGLESNVFNFDGADPAASIDHASNR